MPLLLIFTITLIVLLVGAGLLFMGVRYLNRDRVPDRLREFVVDTELEAQSRSARVRVQPRQLTGSLLSRLFLPFLKGIGGLLGRLTPAAAINTLSRQLTFAGNPLGLGAREFFGLNIVFVVLGLWVGWLLLRRGITPMNSMLAVLVAILLGMMPRLWLTSRVSRRQYAVRKGLPDAMDMLSVCATAGLGFDQSLQRVSEYWNTPIGQEFGRVISEMEMGLSRRDALRNMAERLDIREISTFTALIIQTDQLGMSISDTLHAQAEQMRIERRFRAQEQAQKAPTKMLIPMAFLIFPALLAVLLGPAIPVLTDVFGQ